MDEVLVILALGIVIAVLVVAQAYAVAKFLQSQFIVKQQILLIEKSKHGITIMPIQQIQGVTKK